MAKRRIVYIDGLSFSQWWYFLFFVIGIIVRKYFDTFVRLTDNQYVIAVLLAVFSLTFLCRNEIAHVSYGINVLILGFSGTILSFTFFRKQQSLFSHETLCGRIFQQIGKRTLDIYMIHYFLLPRHLDKVGRFLQLAENPIIEYNPHAKSNCIDWSLCHADLADIYNGRMQKIN